MTVPDPAVPDPAVPDAAAAEAREVEEEFDAATRRLGIEVPADLKGGVLRGYLGLRARAAILRRVDLGPGGGPWGA